MTEAKCPRCKATLEWIGGTNASPEAVASVYLCPDPECGVTMVRLVVEE